MADLNREYIANLVSKYAPELPVELGMAVFGQESNYGTDTRTSPAGAVGGFQVTPTAARDIGISPKDLNDPEKNAEAGLKYLEKQYLQSGKDPFAAAARYFGGPNAMNNLAVRDVNKVSRGDYATQVMDRFRRLGGSVADSSSNELVKEPPGSVPEKQTSGGYLEQLMKAWGISAEANRLAVDSLQNSINVNTTETNSSVDSITKLGSLGVDITLDKAKQSQALAANAARNAATAGIDKDNASSLFASLILDYNREAQRATDIKEIIRDKDTSLGFLDSPLEFLQAHLVEIPQLTREHNKTVDIAVDKVNRIQTLNSMVQTQNVTDAAQFTEMSAEGAIKAAEQSALKAAIETSKLKAANSVQIAGLSVNQASLENKTLNEIQQMEQMQYQKEQRLYIQHLNEEKLEEILKKKEQKAIFEKDLSSLGWTIPAFQAADAKTKTVLMKLMETGKYGTDPVHALINMGILPTTRLSPGQGLLTKQVAEIAGRNEPPATITKAEDRINFQAAAVTAEFKNRMENAQNSMSGENLYHAASPSVMNNLIQASPNFSTAVKAFIKTTSDSTPDTPVEDMVIIQGVIKSIGQNNYSREMAIQDIARYYATAVERNNKVYRFSDMSLPDQVGYKVQVKLPTRLMEAIGDKESKEFVSIPGLFGTQVKADLTNPTAVASLVTLLQAQEMRKGASRVLVPIPPEAVLPPK